MMKQEHYLKFLCKIASYAIITFFLLLSHSVIFFRFFFYKYMVVFLFNTEIYVFLLEEAMYSYC